jgi:hypothetical protein
VFAHSGKHSETLAGNNVSATMLPSLPGALDSAIQVRHATSVLLDLNCKNGIGYTTSGTYNYINYVKKHCLANSSLFLIINNY